MIPAPLRGFTVVELSRFISGSVAGQLLADYGAAIDKLEPPGGDPSRAFGRTEHGSIYFRSYNTGKRCRELDLADSSSRQELEAMLAASDALITNLSPRALARLDLDWRSLHERHPHLTLGAVTGYGLTDDRPCFDAVAQVDSGYARLNAWEDGTPHVAAGYPVDLLAGMELGMGVAMVLCSRPTTGVLVDVAMAEVAASRLCGAHGLEAAETGATPRGEGNRDRATSPAGVYRCRDGHAYVYAGADPHYGRLAKLAGLPDLSPAERVANAERLDAYVGVWTAQRSVREVCDALGELGVPVGPVRDLPDAMDGLKASRPGAVALLTPSGEAVPSHPVLFDGERVVRAAAPPVAEGGQA